MEFKTIDDVVQYVKKQPPEVQSQAFSALKKSLETKTNLKLYEISLPVSPEMKVYNVYATSEASALKKARNFSRDKWDIVYRGKQEFDVFKDFRKIIRLTSAEETPSRSKLLERFKRYKSKENN